VSDQILSITVREAGVQLSWLADVRMRLYCSSQGRCYLRISP